MPHPTPQQQPQPSPLHGKMESVNVSDRDKHIAAFKAAQANLRKAHPWPKKKARKRGR
jgi:hypothetical protein